MRGAVLPSKTRALLPQPWLLKLLHVTCADLLAPHVDGRKPTDDSLYLGGGNKGTQPLDITHSLSLIVEKGLDMHSAASVGQCDVKQYYDFIPLGRLGQELLRGGCPRELVGATLRLHAKPPLSLMVGSQLVTLPPRSRGVMTGAQSAGILSRIPIESVARKRWHVWREFGFHFDTSCISFGNWADNLFAASHDTDSVAFILEDTAARSLEEWGL